MHRWQVRCQVGGISNGVNMPSVACACTAACGDKGVKFQAEAPLFSVRGFTSQSAALVPMAEVLLAPAETAMVTRVATPSCAKVRAVSGRFVKVILACKKDE